MNKQEIFNKVWAHAQKQEPALNIDGECCYRTVDGRRCFIGCLIPDDKYTPQIENITPSNLMRFDALADVIKTGKDILRRIFNEIGIATDSDNLVFLQSLQRVHDMNNKINWDNELRNIAKTYKLTVPQ